MAVITEETHERLHLITEIRGMTAYRLYLENTACSFKRMHWVDNAHGQRILVPMGWDRSEAGLFQKSPNVLNPVSRRL